MIARGHAGAVRWPCQVTAFLYNMSGKNSDMDRLRMGMGSCPSIRPEWPIRAGAAGAAKLAPTGTHGNAGSADGAQRRLASLGAFGRTMGLAGRPGSVGCPAWSEWEGLARRPGAGGTRVIRHAG